MAERKPIRMIAQAFEEGGLIYPDRVVSTFYGRPAKPKIRFYEDGVVVDDINGKCRRYSPKRMMQVMAAAEQNYVDMRYGPLRFGKGYV